MKVAGLLSEREKGKQASRQDGEVFFQARAPSWFVSFRVVWIEPIALRVICCSVLYCPYVLKRIVTRNICLYTSASKFDLLLSMNASSPIHFVAFSSLRWAVHFLESRFGGCQCVLRW